MLSIGEHICPSRQTSSIFLAKKKGFKFGFLNGSLSKNQPESISPLTAVFGLIDLTRSAILSRLIKTPVPPAELPARYRELALWSPFATRSLITFSMIRLPEKWRSLFDLAGLLPDQLSDEQYGKYT